MLTIICITMLGAAVQAQTISEQRTQVYFDSIKNNPEKLRAFLYSMPKGADLHTHESGASLTENMIRYTKNDNFCLNTDNYTVYVNAACPKQNQLAEIIKNNELLNKLIDAWSMRHFKTGKESGHDHFFAIFGKYSPIVNKHHSEIRAEIVERAARQQVNYIELMLTADNDQSGLLGKKLGWNSDFALMRTNLLANGLPDIIKHASLTINQDEAKMSTLLGCQSSPDHPGCQLKLRYLYQVLREQAPEAVFAQLLAGFELATHDARVVGINMVQPEDGMISMRDYKLHMQMVAFLHALYPQIKISLHAGELNSALVPPSGLTSHIDDAINIADANRIGHGVDIMHENNANYLLKEMADKHILVEINLSSNKEILEIAGNDHPFPVYIRSGVPVALSTDDEGLTRDDLTTEYQFAAQTYSLTYFTLKKLARNSIAYSFLPGEALWLDTNYQHIVSACKNDHLNNHLNKPVLSASCKDFLDKNEKAKMQWEVEKEFYKFESEFAKLD